MDWAANSAKQEHHGLLVQRDFELPTLQQGDRVIVQVVMTGHGWQSTQEQCGEYCHAVYRVKPYMIVNGEVALRA